MCARMRSRCHTSNQEVPDAAVIARSSLLPAQLSPHYFPSSCSLHSLAAFLTSLFLFTTLVVLAQRLRSCECDLQQPAALQIEMMSTHI